jgi:hypothetical protein
MLGAEERWTTTFGESPSQKSMSADNKGVTIKRKMRNHVQWMMLSNELAHPTKVL